MAAPRESAMQRIRIGIFGLALIMGVISVSSIMFERGGGDEAEVTRSEEPEILVEGEAEAPVEPLTELGVAPAVETPAKSPPTKPLSDVELDGPNTAPVK